MDKLEEIIQMGEMIDTEFRGRDILKQLDECVNDLKSGNNEDSVYYKIFEYEKQFCKEFMKILEVLIKKMVEFDDIIKIRKDINERYINN